MSKHSLHTLVAFLILTIPNISRAQEQSWDVTGAVGHQGDHAFPSFIESDKAERLENIYSIMLSRKVSDWNFLSETLTLSGYARYSSILWTRVAAMGVRSTLVPKGNDWVAYEMWTGIAHPFGFRKSTFARRRNVDLGLRETDALYDIGLGVQFAMNSGRTRWIGLEATHLSVCASCGPFALSHTRSSGRHPNINLVGITFRQYF